MLAEIKEGDINWKRDEKGSGSKVFEWIINEFIPIFYHLHNEKDYKSLIFNT